MTTKGLARRSWPALLIALLLLTGFNHAAVSQAIKVQGRLTDRTSGTPQPAQGFFNMTFAIWDAQAGGLQITSVGPLSVAVVQGRFEVELPFSSADFSTAERFVEITVNGDVLTPRLRIGSTPFAFQADRTETAASADRAGSADIADLALSVAPGSVGASAIALGAVGTPSLATGAVTADKLGIPCGTGEALVHGPSGWTCMAIPGGAVCSADSFIGCYPGPPGTMGVGACRAGTSSCNAAGTAFEGCDDAVVPLPETCDGTDNDCDGLVDQGNPDGGGACDTGLPGSCGPGAFTCSTGTLQCTATQAGTPELCDGMDNDCDGTVDEGNPGGGGACSTGQPGVCAPGTLACAGGSFTCNRNTGPSAEICDGLDNDCDQFVDDGNPGAGEVCSTGQVGVCALGTMACSTGSPVCTRNINPSVEVCDSLDNDCDGAADENAVCTCPDADSDGYTASSCSGGTDCNDMNSSINPGMPEICDLVNNDCDPGSPDGSEDPRIGAPCDGADADLCQEGTRFCSIGSVACSDTTGNNDEVCNGLDDDCDGTVDEGC